MTRLDGVVDLTRHASERAQCRLVPRGRVHDLELLAERVGVIVDLAERYATGRR